MHPAPGAEAEPAVVEAARAIENLRRHRAWAPRDISIGDLLRATQTNAERVRRRAGVMVDLWTTLLPPELASRTEIIALRGGVLHVRADSSAVAFEIDRRLRGGLLAAMRERSSSTLTRVRVTI